MNREKTEDLVKRLHGILDRVETLLPRPPRALDWERFNAFRWAPATGMAGVAHPHRVHLDDLLCMDRQKAEVVRNTAQFVAGRPANNVLLWGSRGTGKSSLVKAVFHAFEADGLRLIEIDKEDLVHVPQLLERLYERPERFLLYCDDLSFERNDASYKALKAVLEGTIAAPPDNVLIYATSNRRHLIPEYMVENLEAKPVGREIHQGESVEEKVSLSERFGLWLSFYPFTQDDYLAIVDHWLDRMGVSGIADEKTRAAAVRWATQRGSRSGRVARQFALDWAGRQ
jgi:predicted AAA+ superfamily ATPase